MDIRNNEHGLMHLYCIEQLSQAHAGCVRTDNHDGLYPDLSQFHSLRRGSAGSASQASGGNSCGRFNTCGRRSSLRYLHVNTAGCLNDRNNNNSRNNSVDFNDNRIISNRTRSHYLFADWEDEQKAHSNMFSFQNCTLQSEDAGNGDSYWVSFEEKSFCKGNAFKVYSGKMNGRGKKSGDRCVVKVFRKCMGTKSLCSCEVKKSEAARELARVFNKSAKDRNVCLRFAATYWAPMDEVSRLKIMFFSGERRLSSKEAVLFEDDVRMDSERPNKMRHLFNFMDARGRHRTSRATDLDAFMHFTYHESGGRLVVCGLEGVQDSEGFYLKTPTIHSRAREFGNSDGGFPAICEVFRNHICTNLCKDMIKPAQDEESCESEEQFPLIAHCATSSLPGSFSESKDAAMPSSQATPELSSQNSYLSHISSFSGTSVSEDKREIPSAPELPFDHHDLSRSMSCPSQYQSPDPTGFRWTPADDRSKIHLSGRPMPKPRISYMRQNSVPNSVLASTPQSHRIRDPVNIDSATMDMVDLHIQDENANPRRLSYASNTSSKTPKPNRYEAGSFTNCTSGAASPSPVSHNITSRPIGAMERSLPDNPLLCQSKDTVRHVPEPSFPHGPVCGDHHPAQAYTPGRLSPHFEGALSCLPEYPPSYNDSQIATALWVMQRGYGCIPTISHPSQIIPPWEQPPSQSPPYTGKTYHNM